MPLVVVGHGSGASLLHRQAGLGAVERLDLALLVDRQHDGMGRWIDVEADDVAQLVDELGVVGQLELRMRWGAGRGTPDRCTEPTLTPAASAIAPPVQCVVSPGGASSVTSASASIHSYRGV